MEDKESGYCEYEQSDGYYCRREIKKGEQYCKEHKLKIKQEVKEEAKAEEKEAPALYQHQFESELRKVWYESASTLGKKRTVSILLDVLRNLVG